MNAGFESNGVLTANLLSQASSSQHRNTVRFFDQVLQQVRALPAVQSAGVVDDIPLAGGSHQPIAIDGRPVVAISDNPRSMFG